MGNVISCADVVYRAKHSSGREVELRLAMSPAFATPSNAWRRLKSAYGAIDPTSLEIEIRR